MSQRAPPNMRIDTDAQTAAFVRCLGAGHASIWTPPVLSRRSGLSVMDGLRVYIRPVGERGVALARMKIRGRRSLYRWPTSSVFRIKQGRLRRLWTVPSSMNASQSVAG
jgi:hypothetical protein